MNNETQIPVIVIESWFKERLSVTMKNFQANQPHISDVDPDDSSFLNGAWKAARTFLEVEYNTWIDTTSPVNTCNKCGNQEFIVKK